MAAFTERSALLTPYADIVAYTYAAAIFCPDCTLRVANNALEVDGVKVPYLIVEDALNGCVYEDDAQVCSSISRKVYSNDVVAGPLIVIRVRTLDA